MIMPKQEDNSEKRNFFIQNKKLLKCPFKASIWEHKNRDDMVRFINN